MMKGCAMAAIVCVAALAGGARNAQAQQQQQQQQGGGRQGRAEPIQSIEDRTNGLKKIDGFFPLYWDEAGGRLFLEIPKLDTEVLMSTGLATGLGSNDIGLDRGMLTGGRIIKFERVRPARADGPAQLRFRAQTTNAAEARTVRDAFARSVLWGFRSRAQPASACWSITPSSSSATPTTLPAGCGRAATASMRPAAPSTCR